MARGPWPAAHGWLVGRVLVHGPGRDDAGANQLVAKLGESIVGVCFKCLLEALVGSGSLALPPLDDAEARENRCGVGAISPRV